MSDVAPLVLKKGEERRLRAGHLWVFSNEVDVARTPLTALQPGQPVMLIDGAGKTLGSGYAHPNTLIAARLVDRGGHALDRSLFVHRLNVALALRERRYADPFYRLVFGESDGLPGLTVDRFGDVLVAQATTAGMDRLQDEITDALDKVLKPRSIVWKNDSSARAIEGLGNEVRVVGMPVEGPVEVREGALRFAADVIEGQKTGWFYDQRSNRDRLAPWLEGASVLDLFSFAGGWGLRAVADGAASADCVDVSGRAVQAVQANAERWLTGASSKPPCRCSRRTDCWWPAPAAITSRAARWWRRCRPARGTSTGRLSCSSFWPRGRTTRCIRPFPKPST